jgi:hypothetical protein
MEVLDACRSLRKHRRSHQKRRSQRQGAPGKTVAKNKADHGFWIF